MPPTEPTLSPAIARLIDTDPPVLPRAVALTICALTLVLVIWAIFGKLDIVAVADGKLVPGSYLKIVQPAEHGIVREILVSEGAAVRAGEVLMRMDAVLTDADRKALTADFHVRRLALRRIDAQLAERPLARERDDPPDLYAQAQAQYAANRHAHQAALAHERSVLERSQHDLAAAEATRAKLLQVLPHYREQERAFAELGEQGYAGRVLVSDKARERIEKEQDLRAQESIIRAASATIEQSRKRLAQIGADYARGLRTERVDTAAQLERLRQELAKLEHRQGLLELRAPQDGIVKDLATHTPGTVVSPGTVLMSLVPSDDVLVAEVWVRNDDIGFVRVGQQARLKLLAFPFQKYGMLDGTVATVSADAADRDANAKSADRESAPLVYKTLVKLSHTHLEVEGRRYILAAGMQVAAEIKLGGRTVLEYLLSPISVAWHEAGRER